MIGESVKSVGNTANQAWLRALERTAPIPNHPEDILPSVIAELAEKFGAAPALLSEMECFTYRQLAERSNRYFRWVLDQQLSKGDTVCLLMPNRPEYMAIWLGLTHAGVVVSLLNTNLSGRLLAHSIDIVKPRHIIVAFGLVDSLKSAVPFLADEGKVWVHGGNRYGFQRIDDLIDSYAGGTLSEAERPTVTIHDPALHIYTSGTTGMPKAANVSHFRLMQWSYWFAGMMDTRSDDRMYNCLPMYHSVGGVVATGAVLASGGAIVIRDNFSASQFWNDIRRWECTLFQYIGELCRYLLRSRPQEDETRHHIRMCCGNGLRPDVWSAFKSRFCIPQILEFYASTEGNVSLFNIDDKPGAIGRIPAFLAHRFPAALLRLDAGKRDPLRNDQGLCIRSGPGETGEAIGRVLAVPLNAATRFEGYTSKKESQERIIRNVFELGDAWFRTGDLMRKDEKGYFYFVDRIGDTFRWKGENVATSEVSDALCAFPGIMDAAVYGVAIPGVDGRAGMAALVIDGDLDFATFREHLAAILPRYACPLFVRVRSELQITATFKHTKNDLVREGYNPGATADAIYFNDPDRAAFVRLDDLLFNSIQAGEIRL